MTGADQIIQLTRHFIKRKLEPWPEFLAALVIGSVANGEARPGSDVDCIFVFSQLDERIVPAEFVWHPESDAIYTIFEVEATEIGAIQIDASGKRVVLEEFLAVEWEEGLKHELSTAIVLFDRDDSVLPRLVEKLRYPEAVRAARVATHFATVEHNVTAWRLQSWISRGGLPCAHEQLTAAFEDLLVLLHAYNRVWLPWRYRWLISTLKLPWLPDDFATHAQQVLSTGTLTEDDLWRRHAQLSHLLECVRDKVKAEVGLSEPEDTFVRTHPDLGYAHNLEAWKVAHSEFLRERSDHA